MGLASHICARASHLCHASLQEEVFDEISQLVQSALDGYKVCIFAYGQTGSGKTHTMLGTAEERGMIPRAMDQIFASSAAMEAEGWSFDMKVRCVAAPRPLVLPLLLGVLILVKYWIISDMEALNVRATHLQAATPFWLLGTYVVKLLLSLKHWSGILLRRLHWLYAFPALTVRDRCRLSTTAALPARHCATLRGLQWHDLWHNRYHVLTDAPMLPEHDSEDPRRMPAPVYSSAFHIPLVCPYVCACRPACWRSTMRSTRTCSARACLQARSTRYTAVSTPYRFLLSLCNAWVWSHSEIVLWSAALHKQKMLCPPQISTSCQA